MISIHLVVLACDSRCHHSMTAHADEFLVVLKLIQRLLHDTHRDGWVLHSTDLHRPRIDTLVLFIKRLCRHCWMISGGPRSTDSLTGRCIHLAVGQLLLPEFSHDTKDTESLFYDFVCQIPAYYSLLVLPGIAFRFVAEKSARLDLLCRSSFYPDVLNFLVQSQAYCEAESVLTQWVAYAFQSEGPWDMEQHRIPVHRLDPSVQQWMQGQMVKFLDNHPRGVFCWLHPDVQGLFSDDVNSPRDLSTDIVKGTRHIMCGVLRPLEDISTDTIQQVPVPYLYDTLSRELATRVGACWHQSKSHTSFAERQKLDTYILEMTQCVSDFALHGHEQLVVVAIELAILAIIRIGTYHGTISTMQLLQDPECRYCKQMSGHNKHKELLELIRQLYNAQQDVALQSIIDSPDSSPLKALSNEGLDLGHTFMLIAKEMQWHNMALPEAQALAVCSQWMTASDMPCSDEFFRRLSMYQADAENRALLTSSQAGAYIYDDIVDAWVSPESSRPTMHRSLREKENIAPLKRRRRHTDILPRCADFAQEEDDEIDFLGHADEINSSRVRRKVQRLDVAREASRSQMLGHRSCRASLLPYL